MRPPHRFAGNGQPLAPQGKTGKLELRPKTSLAFGVYCLEDLGGNKPAAAGWCKRLEKVPPSCTVNLHRPTTTRPSLFLRLCSGALQKLILPQGRLRPLQVRFSRVFKTTPLAA
jgi:hypothetical protein